MRTLAHSSVALRVLLEWYALREEGSPFLWGVPGPEVFVFLDVPGGGEAFCHSKLQRGDGAFAEEPRFSGPLLGRHAALHVQDRDALCQPQAGEPDPVHRC